MSDGRQYLKRAEGEKEELGQWRGPPKILQ